MNLKPKMKNKKMKLFAVRNESSESDFELNNDMRCGGSNAHSGGAVILAETPEEAERILDKAIIENGSYDLEKRKTGTLKEVNLSKNGIVIFANGDC